MFLVHEENSVSLFKGFHCLQDFTYCSNNNGKDREKLLTLKINHIKSYLRFAVSQELLTSLVMSTEEDNIQTSISSGLIDDLSGLKNLVWFGYHHSHTDIHKITL